MKKGPISPHSHQKLLVGSLLSLDDSPRFRQSLSWVILISGLVVWIIVQGSLSLVPLWNRSLLPETDDTLTYVLKSRQMQDCFNQDCPALLDLKKQRKQSWVPHSNSDIREEVELACSRIFPVYHPLLSLILLGLNKSGLDWMTAYKVIWTAGPVFFGLAFAYLLSTLWGLPAAGIALGLLAFKVFPDTGLHCVVPSNLSMGIAVVTWARIISLRGMAPRTLIIGSILMITMHSIGLLYAVIAAFIALFMSGFDKRKKIWIPAAIILLAVFLILFISPMLKGPELANLCSPIRGDHPFAKMAVGAGETLIEMFANIVRLQAGLFGSFSFFCGAVALGFLTANSDHRKAAAKTILVYLFFLCALLFYVSSHPADIIFRMWIPFVVILFGAVAQAIWYALRQNWRLLVTHLNSKKINSSINLEKAIPILILALLLGYSFHMILSGGEQVYAKTKHLQNRQSLVLDPSQPELLLSQAKPGDRVLYSSMIIMPYYFIHGAMDLGAFYYHPVMQDDKMTDHWLNRSDLRFAVTYNPTVYHPTFEGVMEDNWWRTSPDFHFSPLSKRREHGPISHEGMISASDFKWIEVETKDMDFPKNIRVMIKNPGKVSHLEILPVDETGEPCARFKMKSVIPAKWSGWIDVKLKETSQFNRFRIVLPKGFPKFLIGGIVFGGDPLHWPWAQKATISFLFKDADTGLVKRSFDPTKILPAPLNTKDITVLDDSGSSVLFEIHQ